MHLSLHSFLRKYSFPRKAKGNVSLLVIFVLLASSLIALLAMSQLQHLMSYGNQTFNFFRAHYLAKAGLELSLTEVYLRDPWFSLIINTGDAIVTENFLLWYEGFEPYFSVDIKGSTNLLTNSIKDTSECSGNKISIASWASVVVPLFVDKVNYIEETPSHKNILSEVNEIYDFSKDSIKNIGFSGSISSDLILWLFAFSGSTMDEMIDMITRTGNNLYSFRDFPFVNEALNRTNTQKYLTIVNPHATPVTFCIASNSSILLPSPDTLIRVYAHYGDMEVGLEAVFSKPFPNFLQGLSEFDPSLTAQPYAIDSL